MKNRKSWKTQENINKILQGARTGQDQGKQDKQEKQEKLEKLEKLENFIQIVLSAKTGNTGEDQTGPGK